MKKFIYTALAFLIVGLTALSVTVETGQVKVQYVDEATRTNTVFEAGELCRVTDDNKLVIGDGVTTGGVAIATADKTNTYYYNNVPVWRLITLTNGVAIEVYKLSTTTWVSKIEYTED